MSLKDLLAQGSLKPHKTSKEEIENLLDLVRRDIKDAKVKTISVDRRFAIAYNAVLQMATAIIYCRGYMPTGWGHHYTVFKSLKFIMGENYNDIADYFDSCRSKRNITDYRRTGEISESETDELIGEAEDFLNIVLEFIKKHHPSLLKPL
ncbi:MAG: SAV_6107 family HEPN domain-containing protein [Candidatus Omnitrophota bacterium]